MSYSNSGIIGYGVVVYSEDVPWGPGEHWDFTDDVDIRQVGHYNDPEYLIGIKGTVHSNFVTLEELTVSPEALEKFNRFMRMNFPKETEKPQWLIRGYYS